MKQLLTLVLIGLTSIYAQTVPSYVPPTGLVGWWPFNGNANDQSGNGNNGTVNGATLTLDRNGAASSAYYFSSANCGTRIDATVNTTSIQSGLTISIWAMRVGNGCYGPRLFEFWPGSDGPGQAQWGWDNTNQAIGIGSTTSTGFSCFIGLPLKPDSIWTNLTYTNDGQFGKFYQDGLLDTVIPSQGLPILAGNACFGRMNHPAWDAFNGTLDDIGVWNRALTQQEVQALFYGCSDSVQSQPQNFTAYSNPGWANFKCKSTDTAATYQWQQSNGAGWSNLTNLGSYSGATSDSLVIIGVTATMNNYGYRCIVTGCTTDTSDVAVLTVANGIGLGESKLDKLTISPNPTNGLVSLNAVVLGTYELLTLDGRILESGTAKKEYDLSTYPNGVYNLRLTTDEGTRVLKVVKN
jgi:hypothetical protein